MVGPPGGGTVDLYAPTGFFNLIGKWRHFYHDVRPFYYCCKGEFSDCREYYKHRPSDDGSRYVLQPPGTYIHTHKCYIAIQVLLCNTVDHSALHIK